MQANSDPTDRAREHSGLPLTTDPWEPRGGSAWVVAGMCLLALAVIFHLKLDPAAARARSGAEEQAGTRSGSEPRQRARPAPISAERSEVPAELLSPQSSDLIEAAAPSDAKAPGAGEQSSMPARVSKRSRAELQRLRQALTDAANLERPAVQETHDVGSAVPPAPGAPAEAALDEVPVPPAAPARTSGIPDNPY